MRLVQKKCPNCGAAIDFDDTTKKVKCAYCGQTFFVEKDVEKINNMVDIDSHLEDAYELVNKVRTPFIAIFIIMFFFVMIGIVITFSNIVSFDGPGFVVDKENTLLEENPNLIVNFDQIDEKTMATFHSDAVKSLEQYMFSSNKAKVVQNWNNVGMYLIIDYTFEYSELIDVYDIIYEVNGKEYHLYSAVSYTRLELSDSGVVVSSFDGMVSSPTYIVNYNNSRVFLNGYESLEELFNKEIRTYMSSDYSVKHTDGLYMIETSES
jgi:DNA-directed RNA polymerase subunit RPC12/RpoP/biopolymer transport protein ExbD